MNIKTLARISLLRAEELIKERGWSQGDWKKDMGVCAIQALSIAIEEIVKYGNYHSVKLCSTMALRKQIDGDRLIDGIMLIINGDRLIDSILLIHSVTLWNDIEGQSEFDVRETIVKAAMSLQEKGGL